MDEMEDKLNQIKDYLDGVEDRIHAHLGKIITGTCVLTGVLKKESKPYQRIIFQVERVARKFKQGHDSIQGMLKAIENGKVQIETINISDHKDKPEKQAIDDIMAELLKDENGEKPPVM